MLVLFSIDFLGLPAQGFKRLSAEFVLINFFFSGLLANGDVRLNELLKLANILVSFLLVLLGKEAFVNEEYLFVIAELVLLKSPVAKKNKID